MGPCFRCVGLKTGCANNLPEEIFYQSEAAGNWPSRHDTAQRRVNITASGKVRACPESVSRD